MLLVGVLALVAAGGFSSTLFASDPTGSARRDELVAVVERVKGAVVNIHSERTVQATGEDPFRQAPHVAPQRVNGMGTGIVLDPSQATGTQSIGDPGLAISYTGPSGTQTLRIAIDGSAATGSNHQLVGDSFYVQTSTGVVRVRYADLTSIGADIQTLITPGDPDHSRLLLHPLAPEGGGDTYHSGGRQFVDKRDPDWQALAAWVKGAKKK